MKKILIVVHQETSTPGLVGHLLQTSGYTLDIRCPAIGHSLPHSLEQYAGAVVFGGPMSANDDHLPFIRAELHWISTILEAGKPFLGICLGAQLLARVLGGDVAPHPEERREIGYTPIQPLLHSHNPFAKLTHVYQWHREGFEIPQDAVLLATGEVFTNQAFCYRNIAYGVQFHPEITQEMINTWISRAAEQMELPDAQPHDQQLQHHARHAMTVKGWLQSFLPYWLQQLPNQQTSRLPA